MLEHASAPPSPCTLCALSALAIHAAQGQPGRERRGWYPLGQLEEELDPVARTGDQVVEVLHFMGGEDSPRRVLCPWRAHRLASTLPAVARATAVCFLRCECLRGRGVSRPRDPSHRWGARCSSHGCPAVFRGSQQVPQRRTDALFSRLSRPDEHLAPQRRLGSLGRLTPRPLKHSHLKKHTAVARATAGKVLASRCARQGQSTRRGLSSPPMK